MLTCLYLTGVLFLTDHRQMEAIGPNTSMEIFRNQLDVRNATSGSSFEWDNTVPLVNFMLECEAKAVADALEREGY